MRQIKGTRVLLGATWPQTGENYFRILSADGG